MINQTLDYEPGFIDDLKAGSQQAFEELDRRYRGKLLRVASGILGFKGTQFREGAEDAVQETLLKVFCSIHTFDSSSNLMTWMTRILINQCLDHFRKSKARKIMQTEPFNDENEFIPNDGLDIEGMFERSELRELFLRKLSSMRNTGKITANMHDVIVARSFGEQRYNEIAGTGGLPTNLNTLKVINARGMNRFRKAVLRDPQFEVYLAQA